jgi:hypothetical protein
MKRQYGPAFKAAFAAAFSALAPRQRTLLRQQVLDGLTIDELGALYRVHRATAARWLERAREALLSGTRTALERELKVSATECESIMRLAQSQLHVSIRRLLGEGANGSCVPPTDKPSGVLGARLGWNGDMSSSAGASDATRTATPSGTRSRRAA